MRHRKKGTPVSLERAVAHFGLVVSVKELWTDDLSGQKNKKLLDEVFNNNKHMNETGMRYNSISTPSSDNINGVVVNSDRNSYIQVNTTKLSESQYYTDESEIRIIDGIEYVVFSKTV
jgi:hypothetical protein